MENADVLPRFDLAESIAQSERLPEILDEWLLDLRIKILSVSGSTSEACLAEAVAEAKNTIVFTNASARLVLENLMLNI